MQELDWHDLRFVLTLARGRTLAEAARRLGVNESTVGRRLARAEERLGVRLFERSLGVFHPTEAGRAVIAGAEQVELEVQGIEAAVSGADRMAAGLVRVTSVPILVNRVLVPALPPLLREHPDLQVELIAEPRDLSLTKRETDIALRLARPRKELRAVARRVGRLDYAVFAPAGRDGAGLPWVTYEEGLAGLPQARWIAERLGKEGGARPPVAVSDAETVLHCVKVGLGKSLLPAAVADAETSLRRLDSGPPALSRELWLMVHPELRDLVRIRTVMDWLADTAGRLSART